MFPDLSKFTAQDIRHGQLLEEARQFATDMGGPGDWHRRHEHEMVFFDLLAWGDEVFKGNVIP